MIIFLYGSDTYRSYRKLKELIEYYKKIHKSGLNFKFFEGENLDFQEFKNLLNSASMFKEKKLIVLKGIFSNQNFKEKFLSEKEKILNSDDIILIYETHEITENDSLFLFLKKNSKFQEFKPLEEEKLKNWVKKEFYNFGIDIEKKALEKLIESVGNNLWQMSNEIKKLATYKKRKKIEEKDVELLIQSKIENDIFKTIDALAENKKGLALSLIHKHLEKGDNPLYLLKMINFQFRNLLQVKSLTAERVYNYQALNQINLHPFIFKKNLRQSKKFTFLKLKNIYQKIFKTDLDIKIGRIDPETALDLLISEI